MKFKTSRLTAIWAFSESILGGLLHSFKLPLTGIVCAGIAVIIIRLIAIQSKKPFSEIMYALWIVLIIKLMLSPQSPITAYFALIFQGILGGFLFSVWSPSRLISIIFGIIVTIESAIQRIFTLMVIFGLHFFKAVDETANKLFGDLINNQPFSTSLIFVIGFMFIHGFWGIFVGNFSYNLPKICSELDHKAIQNFKLLEVPSSQSFFRFRNTKLCICLFFLCGIFMFFLNDNKAVNQIFVIVIRPFLVISVWFLVITPILKYLFSKLFNTQKKAALQIVQEIINQIPEITLKAKIALQYAKMNYKGVKKSLYFMAILIFLVCADDQI